MPELSNTVRQRLGSRPAPATHPDADTLTAYAEQLLPTGERNQITEHLAACSFCREVVYLSLPAAVAPVTVHTLPAPSKFWKFGLRWAGAVAVIAIAAVLVIPRLPHKQLAQGNVAQVQRVPAAQANDLKTASGTPANTTPAVEQSPDLALTASVNTRSDSLSHPHAANGASPRNNGPNGNSQPPPPVRGETSVESTPAVALEAAAEAKDGVNPSVPAPSVTSILANSNHAKPVAPQGKEFKNSNFYVAAGNTRLGSPEAYQYAQQEQAKAEADRAKKQSTLTVAQNSKQGFLRKAFPIGAIAGVLGTVKTAATGASAAPETMAADKGTAFAGGAAPVRPPILAREVARTATTITHDAPDAKHKVAAPDQLHWRIQDGKLVNSADLNQWHEAYPGQSDDNIQFKVVQTQDHEVWAGGTNTTLVHSWNGGVDWQKLDLGDAASGDIEKISLSGGDVLVKTSNGQHLISRDRGKTWTPLNGDSTTQPK